MQNRRKNNLRKKKNHIVGILTPRESWCPTDADGISDVLWHGESENIDGL